MPLLRYVSHQTIPPLTDHGDTTPIAHQNLDEKVYDHLHGLIAGRRLAPGTRLTLDALAHSLGVSRTPVINALKRLTQEQYIAWMPRHGIYVREFSSHELAELYEIRAVLEGLSIRLGAQRITDGELAELASMLPSTPPRETAAALRRYVEVDRRFHWRLVELSGSDQLARTMKTVSLLIFSYQEGLARSIADSVREHHEILRALRRRDAERCERLMRRHHELSMERFRRAAAAEREAAEFAAIHPACRTAPRALDRSATPRRIR
jgi:DNA-binding GntR family transcriptional regulator